MIRGVVIGKFYPPHHGHKHLIRTAQANCDQLTVIVCEHPDEKITGLQRAQWIEEMTPGVASLVVDDIVPADDSQGWANYTIASLAFKPDVVFTSEAYGDAYARFLGCRHHLVDLDRGQVPISGTQVRQDPLANWQFLDPCVRAFFALRVCLVGAESTGTTTLARTLAEHFETAWVPEYGRTYCEGKWTAPSRDDWTTDEFMHIAEVQNAMEERLARISNKILFCDTNAWATAIWHERYMGFRAPLPPPNIKPDLYIVTDVDAPFVQDGYRDGRHIREWMHRRFLEQLSDEDLRYEVVSGSLEHRLEAALSACKALLRNYPRKV